MEILIYQIAIGSIILISGVFGRSTRNNIVLVLCLFTVIQIFMLWLAILQFITIIAAYLISNSYVDTNFNKKIALENKEKIVEQPKRKNNIYYLLFVIISAIFFSVFVNLTRHKTKKLVENQKITSIEDSLNKSPELKIVSTLNNIPENNTYIDTTSELGPRVEYLKDLINYTEYCIHPNLSNYYDYKVSVKKIKDEEDNLKIKKIIVEIINKSSNITQQTIIINQKESFYFFESAYSNCNSVRSYITGFNENEIAMDNDYGDLIIADLNFDGNEDFAIKTDSGGNGGPSYKFYTMRNDGVFKVDHFLTNEIRFYPGEIDNINKTLSTFVHADAYGYYENVWKYSMITEKWELIISEYRKANVN